MAIKDSLIGELKFESGNTKKILEKVPADKPDWKPHEKSMKLGRLAMHIAETPYWISQILSADEFDFATRKFGAFTAEGAESAVSVFQKNFDKALSDLSNASDEELNKKWVVRFGEKIMYDTPKKVAIRGFAFNHLVHHRGQLSVYLRLLDIAVPGMYGPSADEK